MRWRISLETMSMTTETILTEIETMLKEICIREK
jgi:hypothetical protein